MKLNGLFLEGTIELMELNTDDRFPCRATVIMPCCGKESSCYTELSRNFIEGPCCGFKQSRSIIYVMRDAAEAFLKNRKKCNHCETELPEKICVELKFKKGE